MEERSDAIAAMYALWRLADALPEAADPDLRIIRTYLQRQILKERNGAG